MLRKEENGIVWLEFELFAPFPKLVHATFLRHGGVSIGPYATLDMGERDKANPYAYKENQRRILHILKTEHLASACQVHGVEVAYVDKATTLQPKCDALMTDKKELALMIRHSDCQAAIFFDPGKELLATVHCGWRGNVQNIYGKVIKAMQERWGARVEDILVGVSASLGPEKAEFIHYKEEFPESFWKFQVKPNYFDLWSIARMQLEEAGVLSEHIQIASICNYSQEQDFFSYRRDHHVTGNHATLALIRDEM